MPQRAFTTTGIGHSTMRRVIAVAALLCCLPALFGATAVKKKKKPTSISHKIATPARVTAKVAVAGVRHIPATHFTKVSRQAAQNAQKRRVAASPWKSPTFANSTDGDSVDGEDLVVRRAAVDALGPLNGTVVVVDPSTGRVLTMVNQKLALQSGYQPCSTIKIVAALAGLSEGVVERNTMLRLSGRLRMGLTEALARSNNHYFSNVGEMLGYERVTYYARLFGLGEKAGLGITGEESGTWPDTPPRDGGVGMMTSFGLGINLTPLQLAALVGSIANGGTLYYLQYPRTQAELSGFVPRVKRQLDIQDWIPEVKPGMMGAVEYGTARRAGYDQNEPIAGKTGTCTDSRSPTHLGWFGSFNDVGRNKLVVVVLLTGGKSINGPVASGVAGLVYKNLSRANFFQQAREISPAILAGHDAASRANE